MNPKTLDKLIQMSQSILKELEDLLDNINLI